MTALRLPSLEALLESSDFVSLHNRLDASTRDMIGIAESDHEAAGRGVGLKIECRRGEIIEQIAKGRVPYFGSDRRQVRAEGAEPIDRITPVVAPDALVEQV